MHLLVFPFVFTGLTAKIINSRVRKKLQPDNPEKQLDIIIASFFKNIKPTNFEGILDEALGQNNEKDKSGIESESIS